MFNINFSKAKDNATVPHVLAAGVWILFPLIFSWGPLIFWMFTHYAWGVLAVIQAVVVFFLHLRGKSTGQIISILLLGWLSQIFLRIGVLLIMAKRVEIGELSLLYISFLSLILLLPVVIPQVLSALGYGLLALLRRKFAPAYGLHSVLIGTLILIALSTIAIHLYGLNRLYRMVGPEAREESTYDESEIEFRTARKSQGEFATLPRPLRIVRTNAGYVGIPLTGKHIPLPSLDAALGNQPVDWLFIDAIEEKAYFPRDDVGYVYNFKDKTTKILPEAMQPLFKDEVCTQNAFHDCKKRELIASHGKHLAFNYASWAGTGEVVVYDAETGSSIYSTTYLGYDRNRALFFWVDGKGYRIFLDMEDGAKGFGNEKTFSIYLEDHPEEYHMFNDNEIMDKWGRVVFSGANSWYFEGKKPILTFESDYPKDGIGNSRFSVRRAYLLEDRRMALEVEKYLITINLQTRTAAMVKNQAEIERLLEKAELLSSDDENAYDFIAFCGQDKAMEEFLKQEGNEFLFCLK